MTELIVNSNLQINLSSAIMRNMAWATLVEGFEIGGNNDMKEHKLSGYLAKPFETSGLANSIEWVLNSINYDEFYDNAREKVVREFNCVVVAGRYVELYKEILH